MPGIEPARALVLEFGLEEHPADAAVATVVVHVIEQTAPEAAAPFAHVDLVEHDVESADLDRPPPGDRRVSGDLSLVDREPDRAESIVVEQRFDTTAGDLDVEPVAVGRAVLLDEREDLGQVAPGRSANVDVHGQNLVLAPVSEASPHPLLEVLERAASGDFPSVDGVVEVAPPGPMGQVAIVEFTGHAVVLSDRPADDPLFVGVDAFGGVTHPSFVLELAGDGSVIGSHDAVLARRGGSGVAPVPSTSRYDDHPRVRRAHHHRRDVCVYGDERGLITVGRGLVGRTELSVEVTDGHHGNGTGRDLILAGLATISSDRWVFAQVAPGNAASLRAFLACDFTPIGSEILIDPC